MSLNTTSKCDAFLRKLVQNETHFTREIIALSEIGDVDGLRKLIEDIKQNGLIPSELIMKARGISGYTALHHACNRGHSFMVFELIKNDLNVNLKNDAGDTALHMAAYNGNLLIAEQLVDCGADIDATNNYNETPLMYAARKNRPSMVRILLQRGADRDINDRFGDKAIDHTDDSKTLQAFGSLALECWTNTDNNNNTNNYIYMLSYEQLLLVFKFLELKDICRASSVAGKWNRVLENNEIWKQFGVRRWEFALQSSLGFGMAPSLNFSKLSLKTSTKKSSNNNNSRPSSTGSNNSNIITSNNDFDF